MEEIIEHMRAGARRSGLGESGLPISERLKPPALRSESDQSDLLVPRPIVLQPSFQPHSDHHYHVNDLLKYHDRAFTQNAYRAILKRGPDAAGFNDFLEALRSGRMNKIDVLARLRYSSEGRSKAVTIDGLLFPAGVRLLYRMPLLGYLLNLVVGLARLPNSLRNEQQFQAHVQAQQEMIAAHANELSQTISRSLSLAETHRQRLEQLAAEHQADRDNLLKRLAEISERLEREILEKHSEVILRLSQASANVENALVGEQAAREQGFDRLTSAISSEQRAREEAFQTLLGRLNEEASRFAALSDQSRTRADTLAKELKIEMQELSRKQQEARAELAVQGERVTRLIDETGRLTSGPIDRAQPAAIIAEADHALDAFYLSLEDQFRGSRAEIKERLRVYLPWIARVRASGEQMPILDVGCGRGEWLELLRDEGVSAGGVDSNRVLVQQCRQNNLEVAEADLIVHLRSLPDASLRVITGFHIIEHLPIETLVRFLDETVRVLRPGGLVIFETPNPQNVLVGTCNFYFDPTHRNPLPSPIAKFLLESRGFTDVEVLNLNPSDENPVAGDNELVRRFNQYFYGPMDYAVIGWRP